MARLPNSAQVPRERQREARLWDRKREMQALDAEKTEREGLPKSGRANDGERTNVKAREREMQEGGKLEDKQ